jgi:putative tricarboxylic transport membrane protein
MIQDHQNLVWAMAFVIAFGSLLASLMGLGMVPGLVKLANVPSRILVPFVLALGFLGVYAASSEISQTIAVFAFGVVGWAMVRYGYSVPAAMIGFLLGKVVENNLYLVRNLQGWAALERPLTALLVAIIVLSLFSPLLTKFGVGRRIGRAFGRRSTPTAVLTGEAEADDAARSATRVSVPALEPDVDRDREPTLSKGARS